MRNPNTISNTIDSVKRAAAALGVSPYGDDGLTFTKREFETETKGAHVFDSLKTLRGRHAVVVDRSEMFTHPASLTVSIAPVYTDFKQLKLTTHMSEHDLDVMLQADNPIAIFTSMNAEIAKFFADNDVNAAKVARCYYYRHDRKTIVHVGYMTVIIQYTPEFEGVRHFYRFDLRGYLHRQQIHIDNTIAECEGQAEKYQALADAKTAQVAKLRKLLANLDKQ